MAKKELSTDLLFGVIYSTIIDHDAIQSFPELELSPLPS
jgi:hypothetical protein